MLDILKVLVALSAGYLLGSVNTAVIAGRVRGIDVRAHGSGGAGLANALRVLGKPAAASVLAGDVLKGLAACLIGLWIGVYAGGDGIKHCVSLLAAGAGAVIGHNWPVFFGFKGGKGVLTAVSALMLVDWRMGLICLGAYAVVMALTGYSSAGSLSAAALFAVLAFTPLFRGGIWFTVYVLFIAATVFVRHKGNIKRLIAGDENKIWRGLVRRP